MRLPILPAGRPWDRVADVVVLLAGIAFTWFTVMDPNTIVRSRGGAVLVVLMVPAFALLFRRRAPMAVGWITGGVAVAGWLVELAAPGACCGWTRITALTRWSGGRRPRRSPRTR